MVKNIGQKLYNFLQDHNRGIHLTHYNMYSATLGKIIYKIAMINFIVLVTKNYIFTSKYEKQRPNDEDFL